MKLKPFFFVFLLGIAVLAPVRAALAQSAVAAPVFPPVLAQEGPAAGPGPFVKTVRRIVIDAGHGGRDFGAMSILGGREKDLTLELALMLRDRLRKDGNDVILTRGNDVFVPLAARANVANKKNADLFVSIHANASTSRTLRGFEVYYLSGDADDAALASERAGRGTFPSSTARFAGDSGHVRQIAWQMREAANRGQSKIGAEKIADSVDRSCAVAAKRLRTAKFQVLMHTECPAVLVEVGYISNREDQRWLARAGYKKSMVDAIADGIAAYGKDFKSTGGFAR